MGETAQGLLQFGALGVVVLMLILAYKIAAPILITWASRKAEVPPPQAKGDLSYNEQAARTIYDVNRSMSQVAVISEQTNEISKRVAQDQQETLKLLGQHSQKSGEFIDTLGEHLIKRLG